MQCNSTDRSFSDICCCQNLSVRVLSDLSLPFLKVIGESGPSSDNNTRPFYDFLESCLRHKSEMVMFEACKAICNLPDASTRELMPPIVVCQLFLSSSKPYLRFAAV